MTDRSRQQPQKKKSGLVWAFVPVAVFAVQGVVLSMTMVLASGSGLRAVEPDYYEQSLDWDAHAALVQSAERLGWTATIETAASQDALGGREISVVLTDAQGDPVRGAQITIEMFHHAHAGDRHQEPLQPDESITSHHARVLMNRAGLWECRLRITRGPESCLIVQDIEVPE